MNKPEDYEDYYEYFNPDGSEKEMPGGMSFAEEIRWSRRQMVIMLSLMRDEKREKFLVRRRSPYWRQIFEIPNGTLLYKFRD